ncbi:hypothetical protein A3D14_00535 [Candidatus Saccharibacteria bacterium RIFCSPHIGHO2_02_FULL_47_12]|nr:MAG: hypothetical protein A3D14_00535 [Candidatus Saccharibacteria bacterium RIFCSPHIGHO2_02_FULL_47_12]
MSEGDCIGSTAEELGSFGPPEGMPADMRVVPSDAPEGAFLSSTDTRLPNLDRLRSIAQTPFSGDQLVMAALEELGLVETPDFIDSQNPQTRTRLYKERAQIERKVQTAYRYYRDEYFDDYSTQQGFDTERMEQELYADEKVKVLEDCPFFQTVTKASHTTQRPDIRTSREAERITRILLRDEAYGLE